MALAFDKYEVTFSKGLNQKADPRLLQEPELVRAVDVEFDEHGGLRLRYPYASIGSNIFGGGTISDCRRVYAVGAELILFTKTAMYSWSSQRSAWVLKGTHLATKIDERPAFVTPDEQFQCDRAQLNGTVVYAWQNGTSVYAAATDASTGAVIMAPTSVVASGSTDAGRPRLVALSTKILLIACPVAVSFDLYAWAIDPASPATGIGVAGTAIVTGANTQYYDVEKIPGADTAVLAARRGVSASYSIAKITAGLVVTAGTKALVCDGPIAVACTPDGLSVQIARGNGTAIQGDLLLLGIGFVATYSGQALGSGSGTINQITAAWVDATTCHVFWSSSAAVNATDWDTDYVTVTSANVVGTAARFIRRLMLSSRAFVYNGQAYVWLAFIGESGFSGASPSEFGAQLQTSNFLYRHDGFLVAKCAWQRAGGFKTTGSSDGYLPNVALTSGTTTFSFCAVSRRVIPLGENQSGYSNRDPLDVTFTFDSNEARRVAKLGETVYITGGEVLQYDGRQLTECGFHIYPHYFGAVEVGTGNLADGVYTLKVGWRWDNSRGERERSTTATHGQVTIAAGPNGISIVSWIPLYVTHKTGVAVEVWRTAVDSGAPFYLTTNPDPSGANPNAYITNDPTANLNATLNDEFADSTLTTKEPNPENGDVLENLAPPAATIITANDTRLFLAGVAGDLHRVWYSKQRNAGEIAAFHDALVVPVPEQGGDITGMAFLNETLVVFRETAIYAIDGQGFDNTGGGFNYQARLVSTDCGAVNHESIAQTPAGLVFKSSKGWYLLDRGWTTQYIGGPVCDYDSESIYAAHLVESQHQLRIVTSGRVLVFDYLVQAWAEWSISDGLHGCMWNGAHHVMATDAVRAQQTTHATTNYGLDVEMLLHFGGLQGFARVRGIYLLGEYRSSHTLRWRIGTYEEGAYFQDKTVTPTGYSAGDEYEEKLGPSQQQHKAIRVRLTSGLPVDTLGEQLKLSALAIDVGMKRGVYPQLAAARRH